MIELSINQLGKYFGADQIFGNLSMEVKEGERIGLIGPNGCGKTTLMKILTKEEGYDEGTVAYRKGVKFGYLSQMPDYDINMKVIDVMTLAFSEQLAIKKQMTTYENKLSEVEGVELDKVLKVYGEISQRFELAGGYEIETRLSLISEGLKLSDAFKEQSFGSLSGGEKTRVELAKTLLEAPDVLLLDEPSNHLDMISIEWLEEFLKNYKGAAIIISHDRYFLDRVVSRIVEMTFNKLIVYHGNYSYYVIEKERRFLIEMKFYEQEQKKIKRVEDQIKRYRVWGAMRDSEKMYKKAKELEKRLSKVEKTDRPVFDNAKVKLRFDHNSRSGKRVLNVEHVSKAFSEKDLFVDVDLEVFYGESVCLLGDNGTGKSTLLKMMIESAILDEYVTINHQEDDLFPEMDSGKMTFGSRLNIGYLPQEVVFENESATILDHFGKQHALTVSATRKELAKVLFVKDDVNKKIENLSGGEKSRLKLCSLMYDKVNLMILDEPTNHLDIDSREILEETLMTYNGSIIFVSHDRYFIAKIANRMAEILNKKLYYFAGNYEYYREQKAKGIAARVTVNDSGIKKQGKKEKSKNDKVPQKYVLEFEELEVTINRFEKELSDVRTMMVEASNDATSLSDLYETEQSINSQLSEYYDRWEVLSEMMV